MKQHAIPARAATAGNGYEVMELLNKNDYDVCLLDFNMPRLDGMETAKLIKASKPKVKIIMLTTYNDKEIIMQGVSEKKNTAVITLTDREIEIVKLLGKEYTNENIANELHISYRTVETHRKNIMQKTKSHNLAGLLKHAYSRGFIK